MASLILFNGFKIEAEQGPYRVKIWPAEALGPTIASYERRKNTPGIGDPAHIEKRMKTIKRKARFRPFKKKPNGHGQIQFLENIRQRNQGRRG